MGVLVTENMFCKALFSGLGSPRGVVCFLVSSERVFRELGVHFWGQHVKGVLKLGAVIPPPLSSIHRIMTVFFIVRTGLFCCPTAERLTRDLTAVS